MNPTLESILNSLIPAVKIAFLSSYLTVRFSLRQFREERRWEKKHEAYNNIFQALFDVLHSYREGIRREEGAKSSEELEKSLSEKSIQGKIEVEKAATIGTFVISDEAVDCIKDYQKSMREIEGSKFNHIYPYFEKCFGVTEQCINKLRPIAKKDLGVK